MVSRRTRLDRGGFRHEARGSLLLERLLQEIPNPLEQPDFALGYPTREQYDYVRKLAVAVPSVLRTIDAAHAEDAELARRRADARGRRTGRPTSKGGDLFSLGESVDSQTLLPSDDYFIADIVGNTICADLLAYSARDVAVTGLEKDAGAYRMRDYFVLATDERGRRRLTIQLTKGGLRTDIVDDIIGILDVRYALTRNVITHHAKCAASAMLGRLATLVDLRESEELLHVGDGELVASLCRRAGVNGGDLPPHDETGTPNESGPSLLARALLGRNLYKRVYQMTPDGRSRYDKSFSPSVVERLRPPTQREDFLRRLEEACHLPEGSVTLWCPPVQSGMKEARVMVAYDKVDQNYVRSETISCTELRGDRFRNDYPLLSGRIRAVEEKYEALWTMQVFVHPDYFAHTPDIQDFLSQEFNGTTNDPLLELYLMQKPEYRGLRRIHDIIARGQHEDARAARQVLRQHLAARGSVTDEALLEAYRSFVVGRKPSAGEAEPPER